MRPSRLARWTSVRSRSSGASSSTCPSGSRCHGAALLRDVAERGPGRACIAGTTGDPRADAEVRTGPSSGSAAVSRRSGSRRIRWPWSMPSQTRIVTASDADEEVRAGLRAVDRRRT